LISFEECVYVRPFLKDEDTLERERIAEEQRLRREAEERALALQREEERRQQELRERSIQEEKARIEREKNERIATRGGVRGVRGTRASSRGTRGTTRSGMWSLLIQELLITGSVAPAGTTVGRNSITTSSGVPSKLTSDTSTRSSAGGLRGLSRRN
jgi:hypothetical protein